MIDKSQKFDLQSLDHVAGAYRSINLSIYLQSLRPWLWVVKSSKNYTLVVTEIKKVTDIDPITPLKDAAYLILSVKCHASVKKAWKVGKLRKGKVISVQTFLAASVWNIFLAFSSLSYEKIDFRDIFAQFMAM